jgi:hypothetical protein
VLGRTRSWADRLGRNCDGVKKNGHQSGGRVPDPLSGNLFLQRLYSCKYGLRGRVILCDQATRVHVVFLYLNLLEKPFHLVLENRDVSAFFDDWLQKGLSALISMPGIRRSDWLDETILKDIAGLWGVGDPDWFGWQRVCRWNYVGESGYSETRATDFGA